MNAAFFNLSLMLINVQAIPIFQVLGRSGAGKERLLPAERSAARPARSSRSSAGLSLAAALQLMSNGTRLGEDPEKTVCVIRK